MWMTGWERDLSDGVSEIMNGFRNRADDSDSRLRWAKYEHFRRVSSRQELIANSIYSVHTMIRVRTLYGREWANSLPDHCVSSSHTSH